MVRKTGSIVKCFDEVHGDFVISDELRKVRVMLTAWKLVL